MEFYKIIDNITLRALVFFLNAVWIQFFIKRLWASLIIAFSVTLLFFVILKKVLEKYRATKLTSRKFTSRSYLCQRTNSKYLPEIFSRRKLRFVCDALFSREF